MTGIISVPSFSDVACKRKDYPIRSEKNQSGFFLAFYFIRYTVTSKRSTGNTESVKDYTDKDFDVYLEEYLE